LPTKPKSRRATPAQQQQLYGGAIAWFQKESLLRLGAISSAKAAMLTKFGLAFK